jgi:large subunit ribosomal protein L23
MESKAGISLYEVLKRPILTEKALNLLNQGSKKKYIFEINKKATKVDVKNAVQKLFNVKVDKINIINIPPKTNYYRSRYKFQSNRNIYYKHKTKGYKKAIITLKEGYKIDFVENLLEKK